MLRQNSGTPIRLQNLQLMHSFGVATSACVYKLMHITVQQVLRRTQQRQTKKLTVIGVKGKLCQYSARFFRRWVGFSEQKEVVEALLKTDVFVILPTGFGKSACYQCLPLLHKKLYPDSDSAIIVVVVH